MPRAIPALLSAILLAPAFLLGPRPAPGNEPAFLVSRQTQWKYTTGPAKPPQNWNQPDFDDSTWKSGQAGFGYGDGDDRTVLRDMRGRYTSVYVRTAFELMEGQGIDSLYLYVNFDDGFVAYLNGRKIAAASVTQADGKTRIHLHEARGHEEFAIPKAGRVLKPGWNVLAIEGHNATIDSSDFSLDPILATRKLRSLIGPEDFLADLDEFERRLLDQSSYLKRRGFDYTSALKEIRKSIDEDMQLPDFVCGLKKLVMQIGDCHANVASNAWPGSGGFLPLRPAETSQGIAALAINQNEPLDPKCPYLDSIDGLPLEEWRAVAARFVPRGSPQLVRRQSLDWLGYVSILRNELDLPANETVIVGLRSADGKNRQERRLRLTAQGYAVAGVSLGKTRTLDGNFGYLRIPSMDKRLVDPTVEHIKSFRDTNGLIIDVRHNGGGTYHLLDAVYPFFVPGDAKPYVTNIAAYRLSPQFKEDHIAYRPTYRADWNGWNREEITAIEQAARAFRPEWQPPNGEFSEWHYMVLSRDRNGQTAPRENTDYFYYDRPVVVLCDANSFSATDGFLSAFADLPQVTLVGESSGGGSGATRRFTLPNTGITVALSSMASFRANGKLFDGNGIEVDIPVKPSLEDYTAGTDSVVQQAITLLKRR